MSSSFDAPPLEALSAAGTRLTPSSFDGNDIDAPLLQRSLDRSWPSLTTALAHWGSKGLIYHLPVFWQAESSAFASCREAGTFIAQNDSRNLPVAERMLTEGGADAGIAESAETEAFLSYLKPALRSSLSCIIVHRYSDERWLNVPLFSEAKAVAHEVHLFPGVPILVQCEHLIDARSMHFHLAKGYSLEQGAGVLTVSETQREPEPLLHYPLGGVVVLNECACGMPTLARAGEEWA